ncbi:chaperonin 10-like protein [Flagelloscypha sp. PMI_526]|nr:chaperonin 10-like protein [Flagelloscypha sp. PMI_526]
MLAYDMLTVPDTIKGLRISENRKTLDVVDIPLAIRNHIENVPEGYVLLKVRAIGLNPADWKTLYSYGFPGGILGCDAAGDIVAVGSGVTHLSVGDRAGGFTLGLGLKERPGAFAEYALLSASGTFKLPDGQTYVEAAALPIPLFTAVQTLYFRHNLALPSAPATDNTPILIWGASTAVGHYAIQLASLSGYKVVTTASPDVFDEVKTLGASEVFDYKDPETPKKIQAVAHDLTMAIDTAGGTGTLQLISGSLCPTSNSNKIYSIVMDSSASPTLPSNTTVEYTLVYEVLGFPFKLGELKFPVRPDDVAGSLGFIQNEYPRLFEGGENRKIKIQKLRIMPGGLESVVEGMNIMKDGKYGREKLVYNIA